MWPPCFKVQLVVHLVKLFCKLGSNQCFFFVCVTAQSHPTLSPSAMTHFSVFHKYQFPNNVNYSAEYP